MAKLTSGKVTDKTWCCPVCDSDLFWEKVPVTARGDGDEHQADADYCPGWSAWERAGDIVLECAGCGSRLHPAFLGTDGDVRALDGD